MEFINQYITTIKKNTYKLTYSSEDIERLKEYIIFLKNSYHNPLTIDDLYLIRITKEKYLPKNMTYFPLDYRNCLRYIDNPFKYIIGWTEHKIGDYENMDLGGPVEEGAFGNNKLATYYYRYTKHFSINGLASNIYNFLGPKHIFDDGDFIILEPLKNKIEDPRLVILNPVDTFFDLHEKEMKIGEDAIFIIKDSVYQKLDSSTLKKLGNRKVYLFDNEASAATDIVLLSLGILPQHSIDQSKLISESYFTDKSIIDDEAYLRRFQDLIEETSQNYLHQSYQNPPVEITEERIKNFKEMVEVPGILHSETPYFKEEQEKNEQSEIKTYQEYMFGLIPLIAKVPEETIRKIVSTIEFDVKEKNHLPIVQTFFETYQEYEKELLNIMLELSYPNFQKYTEEFNQKKLKKIDKNRIG